MIATRRRRRGIVLVIILWISAVLVAVAIYFAHGARMAYLAAEGLAAGLQAEHAIDGTLRYLVYTLDQSDDRGVFPSVENGDYVAEDLRIGDARIWLLGTDPDATIAPTSPVFGLLDEGGKLNLNRATLEMIEALPDIPVEAAAAIVDWVDIDSDVTSNGAEASDYLALTPSYAAKDGPLETIGELRHVMNIDMEVLHGEDRNANGVLDANEDDGDALWPPDDANGTLRRGIAPFVTVYTREPNTQDDGSQRVNIRGDGARQELSSMMTVYLGEPRTNAILNAIGPNLQRLDSPLALMIDGGLTAAEFALIEHRLTTVSGDYIVGRVNVATAPAEVLACLPGVGPELAARLVATRAGLDRESLKSTAWIVPVLGNEAARLAGPYVTARSHQYTADIVAVGRGGRGYRRVAAVINREEEVQVIHRRDLGRLGWPLGEELGRDLRRAKVGQ